MNKDIKKFFVVVLSALTVLAVLTVLTGCPKKSNDDTPASKSEKADKKKSEKDKKEKAKGSVVGTPAPGSKFSKIKIGMTMNEVFAKIGHPHAKWQRPTGKSEIPFYFGDDRWVIECSYKGEGRLTFNSGGEQALTKIEVNRKE